MLQLWPLSGLWSQGDDELCPMQYALAADNCELDRGGIFKRHGYRRATAAAIGTGVVQGIWRYRPAPDFSRVVVARDGTLYGVTDPSSETVSDGTVTTVATGVFGAADLISATQLGKFLYVASDDPAKTWRRIRRSGSSLAIDNVTGMNKPAPPTTTAGSLTLTAFNDASHTITDTGVTLEGTFFTTWRRYNATSGGTVVVNIGTDRDWSGVNWLLITMATAAYRGTNPQIAIELATLSGNFETLETVSDVGDRSNGFACVWVSLAGLSAATRAAVRRFRFRCVGNAGRFAISQFLPVPASPGMGQITYYVTAYDTVTQQESDLSDKIEVVYSAANLPQARLAHFYGNADAFYDQGTRNIAPDQLWSEFVWNAGAGKAYPTVNEIYTTYTFNGTITSGNRARLYRQTPNGLRLVKEVTTTGAYSITDDVGDRAMANAPYKAGGLPPACAAMTARGGRIVCGGGANTPNRVFVSSYVPINTSNEGSASDPFVVFPAAPQIDSDGFSFDIAPTASERVLSIINGDYLYILTNECCYYMSDVTLVDLQQRPVQEVWRSGVLGRAGALWCEYGLFWATANGIYQAANGRPILGENLTSFSHRVMRTWKEWLQPDSNVLLAYQNQKLYAVQGTKCLRYDFVTDTWTRWTLAHTNRYAARWTDAGNPLERLWMLDTTGHLNRFQPGLSVSDTNRATTDAGTSIPAWQYQSGFNAEGIKTRFRFVLINRAGSLTFNIYKNTGTIPTRTESYTGAGVTEQSLPPDLTSYFWRIGMTSDNTLYRVMVELETIDGRGG